MSDSTIVNSELGARRSPRMHCKWDRHSAQATKERALHCDLKVLVRPKEKEQLTNAGWERVNCAAAAV
jgi:hypothetical protein